MTGTQHLDFGLLTEEVGGHLKFDGPGATLTEPHESLDKVIRNGFDLVDAGVPVGHGGEHAQLVLGLVGRHLAAADKLGLDVGGHLQDGGGREVRLAHGSDGVGSAGAGAGQDHAGFAGGTGVAVGHIAATQLEAPADEPDIVLAVEQCVEQVEGVDGYDAEHGVDTLGVQGRDHSLAAGHLGHGGNSVGWRGTYSSRLTGFSRTRLISMRNCAASAPSATRWSVERVAFIMVPTVSSPSRTTGCCLTLPTARMAAWGG